LNDTRSAIFIHGIATLVLLSFCLSLWFYPHMVKMFL